MTESQIQHEFHKELYDKLGEVFDFYRAHTMPDTGDLKDDVRREFIQKNFDFLKIK